MEKTRKHFTRKINFSHENSKKILRTIQKSETA